MSGKKCEERVPELPPRVEERVAKEVRSWPLTSLRSLISALEITGCTIVGEVRELQKLRLANSSYEAAFSRLDSRESNMSSEKTAATISLIEDVERAGEELRRTQEEADGARPSQITVNHHGDKYELKRQAGSYVIQFNEKETWQEEQGKMRMKSRKVNQKARGFANALSSSYCLAEDRHKETTALEESEHEEVLGDLKKRLGEAKKIQDQWDRVREVSRIRDLVRERVDWVTTQAKKHGHPVKQFEFDDEFILAIDDSGPNYGSDDSEEERVLQ